MNSEVAEYQQQLQSVEKALQTTNDATVKAELEALKANLQEVLQLLLPSDSTHNQDEDNDSLNAEMQLFQSEIAQLSATVEKTQDTEDLQQQMQALKLKLEAMLGQKCSAPHEHSWGAVTYHNAIVCGIAEDVHVDDNGQLLGQLRVLFTNPTHREMLPCAYYLDGECRFDETRCHYSHGELVPLSQLRDYAAPEFERLGRNCLVLAKLKDRLWHRGRVLCANFMDKSCLVRLEGKEQTKREQDFAFEDLLPIFQPDDDNDDDSDGETTTSSDDSSVDEAAAKHAHLVQQSLLTLQPTQPLGEWEKHTRGIGSKLLRQMGYVLGTGLGSDGQGIIMPVSAQILPQGRSLDHCMELREAANGDKNLFSVEQKLHREQKKQEALNAKAYAREKQKVNVFSFLNDSIFGNNMACQETATTTTTKQLQEHSVKSLNVQSVRVADDIRRKQKEIAKINVSLQRNAMATEVQKRLQAQKQAMTLELNALQQQEQSLTREQNTRKSKHKLCVF